MAEHAGPGSPGVRTGRPRKRGRSRDTHLGSLGRRRGRRRRAGGARRGGRAGGRAQRRTAPGGGRRAGRRRGWDGGRQPGGGRRRHARGPRGQSGPRPGRVRADRDLVGRAHPRRPDLHRHHAADGGAHQRGRLAAAHPALRRPGRQPAAGGRRRRRRAGVRRHGLPRHAPHRHLRRLRLHRDRRGHRAGQRRDPDAGRGRTQPAGQPLPAGHQRPGRLPPRGVPDLVPVGRRAGPRGRQRRRRLPADHHLLVLPDRPRRRLAHRPRHRRRLRRLDHRGLGRRRRRGTRTLSALAGRARARLRRRRAGHAGRGQRRHRRQPAAQ